jgi:serine/threonine-protein kinase
MSAPSRRHSVNEGLAVSQRTGARLVRLNGILDENFDRNAMLQALAGSTDPVVFDLDGVRRITSFGVREWILALQSLPTDYYFFIHCRPSWVAQLNMVSNFSGCGQVVTIYCPYACSQCERSFEVLMDLRTHRDRARRAHPLSASCPECKSPAVFDDTPESYFTFFGESPPVIVPPAVERIIGSAAMERLPLKIAKEVDGAVTAIWISGTLDEAGRFRRLHEGLEGQVVIIVQGVAGMTPEGLAGLTDFLGGAEEPFSLARVPLELVRAVVEFPDRWQHVRLISVRLAWRCQACGMAGLGDLDVKDQAMLMLRTGKGLRKCHFCMAEASGPMLLEDDLEMVLSLNLMRPGQAVASYLECHDQPAAEARAARAAEEVARGPSALQARTGRYEIIKPLGKGGMAEVFLGRQLGLEGFEKSVVIKCISRKFASDPRFVDMFLREARMAARIIHSNVVQIFDLGRSGDNYYIVMEYVRGCSLNDIFMLCTELKMEIPIELCCRIVSDVCAGLHAAHNSTDQNGQPQVIIHRDVSPENVLISYDGLVKLADFGIAKAVAPRALTRSGSIEGKILYMAPETAREDAFDHRADVFAAGLLFYVALTGQHPFKRTGYVDTLASLLGDEIPRVDQLREVPEFLGDVVDRAMMRDPDNRYQSALALHLDLESFLARNGKPATSTYLALFLSNLIRKGAQIGVRLDFTSPKRVVRDGDEEETTDAIVSTSQTIIEFRSEHD